MARHARRHSVDRRAMATHAPAGIASDAAARRAMSRTPTENQARGDHRTGLILVSNSPTSPTSSPDAERRRAISSATSPPDE
jgi:hypothetical protein